MKVLIVVTKNYHEDPQDYEWPDVYTVETDGTEDIRERAAAIMKQLHQNYLDTEKEESSISVNCELSYCNRETGYGQIVWANGDIHQYFLVDDTQKAEQVLKEYCKYQEGEEAGRIPQDIGNAEKVPQDGLDATPSNSLILNLSTVHVHPDAMEFLSEPMTADALQVFPISDQCVLHIVNAKAAGDYDIPPSVKDCIRHAGKCGCSWIHFSYEADESRHLPTYRTSWDRVM